MSAQLQRKRLDRNPLLDIAALPPGIRRLCWGCAKPFPVAAMTPAIYRGSRAWECAQCRGTTSKEDGE